MNETMNPENKRATLLEKINKAMAELGSTAKWKKVPEYKDGFATLKGKNVVMVDDVKIILENIMPQLVVATDGNASCVEYVGQQLEDLVLQILALKPDIIAMDYNLSDDLKGTAVLEALKDQGYQGDSVGFSSDRGTAGDFAAVGAKGVVDKGLLVPDEAVEKLAELFEKK